MGLELNGFGMWDALFAETRPSDDDVYLAAGSEPHEVRDALLSFSAVRCAALCEECDAELVGGVCPALKCDACQTCLDSIGQVVDGKNLCRECVCSAERDKEWAAYDLEVAAAAAEGRDLDIGKTPCW